MAKLIYQEPGAVTVSSMWEEDGEIINTEQMPKDILKTIVDDARSHRRYGDTPRLGNNWGRLVARIPITEYTKWRKEWGDTSRKDGVPWKQFLACRLNSAEYSYLRFEKV